MSYFYENLPPVTRTQKYRWLDNSLYRDFDKEWFVVSLDIKGSTKAVERGEYKEVNMLSSACIVAFLNASKYELPFVFGGDGATILIPKEMEAEGERLILMCKRVAHQRFNLELRGNLLSVTTIYEKGKKIEVLKEQVDKNYTQAIFKGGGLSYAEAILKQTHQNDEDLEGEIEINFEGLECRWEKIKSPLGLSVSLLVEGFTSMVYQEVLEEIEQCFGTQKYRRPVSKNVLNLSFSLKNLLGEVLLKEDKFFIILKKLLGNFFENILGFVFMKFSWVVGKMPWGEYKDIVMNATDSEKFEDMLKMVIACDKKALEKFERFLEKQYRAKKLNYGLHISDSSIMTCLVFQRDGRQVHFIDSTAGGYTLAAKSLKQRH